MTEEEKDLLRFAPPEARTLCGVDRRTWERWRRGRHRIPRAVLELLRILTLGELPQGGDAWTGWRFWRGELYAPNGWHFTPGELLGVPLLHAEARRLRNELQQALERRTRAALYLTREEVDQIRQALELLQDRLPAGSPAALKRRAG